jgi:hypothetical protein
MLPPVIIPRALNNILEPLTDVVGRAHRTGQQLDVHANGGRYRYHNGAAKGGVSLSSIVFLAESLRDRCVAPSVLIAPDRGSLINKLSIF